MNAKQLAKRLNGREYGNEIRKEEEKQAKEDGLVVCFGYSDDNMELVGAINDEIGAYGGRNVRVSRNGVLQTWEQIQDGDEATAEKYFKAKAAGFKTITTNWCKDGYSWVMSIDCPFEPFDIMEDGEKFCRGIVFSLSDL